jgi:hypothetical protein
VIRNLKDLATTQPTKSLNLNRRDGRRNPGCEPVRHTYKDLPHGTYEIVTRDGRVILHDDPGETIVIDPSCHDLYSLRRHVSGLIPVP